MLKRSVPIIMLLLILPLESQAFDLTEPLSILGSEVIDVFDSPFVPQEIFSNRGVEADEDNVVFYYTNGFYLFLFNNRVWQIRFDKTFQEEILNLQIGMIRSEVLSAKLDAGFVPISNGEDFVTFKISDSPYPVRMKLFFQEDELEDLYIYRADF